MATGAVGVPRALVMASPEAEGPPPAARLAQERGVVAVVGVAAVGRGRPSAAGVGAAP